MSDTRTLAPGTPVRTRDGHTGHTVIRPKDTPLGPIVTVQYDDEHAHLTPTGRSDYPTSDLTVITGPRRGFRELYTARRLTARIPDTALREATAAYFDADNIEITDAPDADITITVNPGREELTMQAHGQQITRPMPGFGYTPGDVPHRARAFYLNPADYLTTGRN